MAKKSVSKTAQNKAEISVAKINLLGVIVAAILGLAGVALTAYFGYLATRPVQLQVSTNTSVVSQPTPITGVVVTPSPTPTTNLNLNANSWLVLGAGCFSIFLAVIITGFVLTKRFLRYAEVDMRTTRMVVDRREIRAQLLLSSAENQRVFDIFGTTRIGRSPAHADLIFQQDGISRLHCIIEELDGIFWIRDEESNWGTYLNGNKLKALELKPLHNGDTIRLGQIEHGGIEFYFRLTAHQGEGQARAAL